MKSLFDSDFHYTDDAEDIRLAMDQPLQSIFYHYCVDGEYSPREVAHVINAAVTEYEGLMIDDWKRVAFRMKFFGLKGRLMIKEVYNPTDVILEIEQTTDDRELARLLNSKCEGYVAHESESPALHIPTQKGVSWQF